MYKKYPWYVVDVQQYISLSLNLLNLLGTFLFKDICAFIQQKHEKPTKITKEVKTKLG